MEVETVFEELGLVALFETLLVQCSHLDRKILSSVGGIRRSPEDIGWPAP